MTDKLYYSDSHLYEFDAVVTGCTAGKGGWALTLDRTAFFPEGGGQRADTGLIGEARVSDVHEKDGEILHYADSPLEPGTAVRCVLDREQRYRRMQNHSGEHVVSGLTHKLYGFDNVGFHMGEDCMTIDFSGELTREQLQEIETLANETVRANVPVRTWFPSEEELRTTDYRSKLELTHDVRLVEIPGCDVCACCAPHVYATGEIGLIKILDCMRHRGGVRVSLICGMDALDAVRLQQKNVTAISGLLSARRDETAAAVEKLLKDRDALKEKAAALAERCAVLRAAAEPKAGDNFCVFEEALDEPALRRLVNLLTERTEGIAAVFAGSDTAGYRYVIGSRGVNLRTAAGKINRGIDGRGGGSPEMIQGSCRGPAASIQEFIQSFIPQD